MNKITVDFDMVYNDIVIYCKLQFENPISAALAIPVGTIRLKYVDQSKTIRLVCTIELILELCEDNDEEGDDGKCLRFLLQQFKTDRMRADMKNLKIK